MLLPGCRAALWTAWLCWGISGGLVGSGRGLLPRVLLCLLPAQNTAGVSLLLPADFRTYCGGFALHYSATCLFRGLPTIEHYLLHTPGAGLHQRHRQRTHLFYLSGSLLSFSVV